MGGFASGLFDLFAGNPAAKEQQQFGGFADWGIGEGEGDATTASTYFNNVLTDPTKALAPEIAADQGQIEQQRLTDANFGNRSGGTNATTQNAEGAGRGDIIKLMGDEQGKAAGEIGTLGTTLTGQGENALGSEANLAETRRSQVDSDVGNIAQGAAELALGIPGMGGGGADPYETLYNAQHADTSGLETESPDITAMI